ncbi:MAG: response regulator transcription factor [Oscillospiraceae bacterium]|nr:response regulator transcription factor [Oscillospiraceae bacterium]
MIYCLEDDKSIRELIAYSLKSAGLESRCFELPSDFHTAMAESVPDLILLDIMLPEEDGLSVLRSLRADERSARVPVILLTARGTEFDKVLGLDCGADDYVTKPFSIMELLARIRSHLRRTGDHGSREYRLGELRVSEGEHTVQTKDGQIPLTLKEFKLLCLLLENRGRVLSRDVILEKVWGYAFDGENRTVDVHIRSLRQKLGESGDYIETVRGVGYKINKE